MRLILDMTAKANALRGRSQGYRMAGMRDLARDLHVAAERLEQAALALQSADGAEQRTRSNSAGLLRVNARG